MQKLQLGHNLDIEYPSCLSYSSLTEMSRAPTSVFVLFYYTSSIFYIMA